MDAGKITLPNERSWTNVWNSSLKLFSDTFVIRNMTGMNVYDIRNNLLLHLPDSKFDGVVYGTTQYMKLPLMIDTAIDKIVLTVDDCAVSDLPLPYLARNYTAANDRHIWIPLVPGLGTICITVDGTELIMRVEDFQSGDTSVSSPEQSGQRSTAPGFKFDTTKLRSVTNVAGNPLSASVSVGTGSQFVATTSGHTIVSVSGTVLGTVDTVIIREYSDTTLSGIVRDVENSGISIGINVYKNSEHIKYVSLGRFDASGLRSHMTFNDLPQKELFFEFRPPDGPVTLPIPVPELEMPWHQCEFKRIGGFFSLDRDYYKCVYRQDPSSNSVCTLAADYQIRGNLNSNDISFDVEPGDVIEYRLQATLSADHSTFDCGNVNTTTYGNTKVTLDLKNAVFDHNGS